MVALASSLRIPDLVIFLVTGPLGAAFLAGVFLAAFFFAAALMEEGRRAAALRIALRLAGAFFFFAGAFFFFAGAFFFIGAFFFAIRYPFVDGTRVGGTRGLSEPTRLRDGHPTHLFLRATYEKQRSSAPQ